MTLSYKEGSETLVKIMRALGLTSGELSKLCEIPPSRVTAYKCGSSKVPRYVWSALNEYRKENGERITRENKESLERLEEVARLFSLVEGPADGQ